MKELTKEEKAKAYDGLVERLKDLKFACRFSPLSDTIDEIFPELKENEDERIRKDIVFYIAAHHKDDGEKARWLAWLEKQGEQKPADKVEPNQEWSEEDKNMLQSILDEYKSMTIEKRNWLKSLKDRYAWKPSDEQMKALNEAIYHVDDFVATQIAILIRELSKL